MNIRVSIVSIVILIAFSICCLFMYYPGDILIGTELITVVAFTRK